MSLTEILMATTVLMILMGLVFQSSVELTEVTARESTQSYATARARGAMEISVRSLRSDLVQFNTVPGTPLSVNFDLDDEGGKAVVRDGILYYFDSNHTAQIYQGSTNGQPFTAGLDDTNGDGKADVMGMGLVPQDENGDGVQDFIDLNNDGQADDLDHDGNRDPLWTLTMVHFNSVNDVSNVTLWRKGRILTTNIYIRRLDPAGPLSGNNIDTFQYSAHNPVAMWYDTAAFGGNGDDTVQENELGNMTSVDGIINAANEVASIDSITITLRVAQVAEIGTSRKLVLSGDISSDLITPRTLQLMRLNGIVGVPDPAQPVNIS